MKKVHRLLGLWLIFFWFSTCKAELLLFESFEGALDSRLSVSSVGLFATPPGTRVFSGLSGSRAFGFGRSINGASSFFGFVSTLTITFDRPTFVDSVSFIEREAFSNWGSQGEFYTSNELPTPTSLSDPRVQSGDWGNDFGRLPHNDFTADTTFRLRSIQVDEVVTSLSFQVWDITNLSEIYLDDLTVFGREVAEPASILAGFVYHDGWTGSGTPMWNKLDTSKTLVKEGTLPQTLTFNNLINTAQGINGMVFDIENLPDAGNVSVEDFEFQVSPQGAFDAGANPPANWQSAPAPSSIAVTPGSPDRVLIQWPDQTIMNRWLRITVLATEETGIPEPETYYIGHLLGETTVPTDGVFTVSFADITPIRADVGQTVDASSITDIDKNGTVSFADISAMRGNVGSQLTQISVP